MTLAPSPASAELPPLAGPAEMGSIEPVPQPPLGSPAGTTARPAPVPLPRTLEQLAAEFERINADDRSTSSTIYERDGWRPTGRDIVEPPGPPAPR